MRYYIKEDDNYPEGDYRRTVAVWREDDDGIVQRYKFGDTNDWVLAVSGHQLTGIGGWVPFRETDREEAVAVLTGWGVPAEAV